MLIVCPECELQVSDKATSCPHCGYPLQQNIENKKPRNPNKRKRLPNGFGQITKIKNRNLRNPYRAMITVGKDENGKPICELLKPNAFFPSYNEAYAALLEYNRNPYDLSENITMKELYERWSEEYFKKYEADSTYRSITAAWAYCSSVYDMKVSDMRIRHFKGCINDAHAIVKGVDKKPSANTKKRMKSLFNLLMDYAVEYEIASRNYAREFNIDIETIKASSKTKRTHISFTDKEMNILWDNVHLWPYIDMILIQCYSGWRPQELISLEIKNVNLDNWTFIGGSKTDAGINRIVPIHEKIKGFVKTRYDEAVWSHSKYLFNCTDSDTMFFTYSKYYDRFINIMKELGLNENHRPHDARKQFVTMAKRYGMDEYAIKRIVGHAINDITETIYTTRSVEWLTKEMQKIE